MNNITSSDAIHLRFLKFNCTCTWIPNIVKFISIFLFLEKSYCYNHFWYNSFEISKFKLHYYFHSSTHYLDNIFFFLKYTLWFLGNCNVCTDYTVEIKTILAIIVNGIKSSPWFSWTKKQAALHRVQLHSSASLGVLEAFCLAVLLSRGCTWIPSYCQTYVYLFIPQKIIMI